MRKNAIIPTIISLIFLLMLVAAGVLGIAFVKNGQRIMRVSYGEADILHNDIIEAQDDSISIFTVKSVVGSTTEYSVKVTLNPQNAAFDFIADGKWFTSTNIDMSKALALKSTDTFFSIEIPKNLTLNTLLKNALDAQIVSDIPQKDLYAENCIQIEVVSGTETLVFTCKLKGETNG